MIIHLKYFYDSVNIVLILAPGRECVEFPLTFLQKKLNEGYFPWELIIHFLEKYYQEINLKSHLNSAPLCK